MSNSKNVLYDAMQYRSIYKAGTYEMSTDDNLVYIDDKGLGGAFVLNLPSNPNNVLRKQNYRIVVKSATSVTVNAPQGVLASDGTMTRNMNIDGASSKTVTATNGILEVIAVDSETFIIMTDK